MTEGPLVELFPCCLFKVLSLMAESGRLLVASVLPRLDGGVVPVAILATVSSKFKSDGALEDGMLPTSRDAAWSAPGADELGARLVLEQFASMLLIVA